MLKKIDSQGVTCDIRFDGNCKGLPTTADNQQKKKKEDVPSAEGILFF
ncbi:hypothetical protein [Diplocloster agilis]|nr:hypothetical protein [Suonthocola fibrivorans]MCU6734678.1 hypothetical protein [Suonthocola fibrivorans]SCJ49813.1 Uncharacterised protein [uncultured Clostridium sp.]